MKCTVIVEIELDETANPTIAAFGDPSVYARGIVTAALASHQRGFPGVIADYWVKVDDLAHPDVQRSFRTASKAGRPATRRDYEASDGGVVRESGPRSIAELRKVGIAVRKNGGIWPQWYLSQEGTGDPDSLEREPAEDEADDAPIPIKAAPKLARSDSRPAVVQRRRGK